MGLVKFLGSVALILVAVSPSNQYKYETKTFDTKLDHFSFTTNATFKLRYLINDSWWDPTLTTSSIFFYTGNEGDISLFADNAGLVWEFAPDFNALVVFAEHRYYGESLPFGNLSFSEPKYSGYLSSLQALADYIDLIAHLKSVYPKRDNAPTPVIAFGGSYGGMLSAWIRMKYPGVISGALAASAPIWQFTGMTSCDAFNKAATRAFSTSGTEKCVDTIKNSWSAIETVAASDGGLKWISQTFKTCDALQSANDLKNYLNNMYGNMAMANYPYPANFLAELPGQPVKAMCDKLITTSTDPKTILQSLFEGTSIYFNYTGTSQCLDLSDTDSQDLGMEGWTYQTCTEMVMPMCDKGDTMFQKTEWNLEETSDECYAQFQVRPIVNYVRNLYGAKELSFTSNIIFSNGYLDPWSSGGVLHSVSKDSLVTGPMQGAAHHLDLRSSNPLDPPSIKRARQMYRKVMTRWLDHFSFTTNATFKLRYLINDSWWDPTLTTSSIFFYTGNEGDISLFADNAGLVWEFAPDFNALVVFAEHRYYGESLPFGNLSFSEPKYSGYLSSLQALADYIDLIAHLKSVYPKRDNAPTPVIAFGGSYGGMLSAWIRMKYPGVISGALAASAPIWQFTGMTSCDAFNKAATRAFSTSGTEKCVDTIKNSWSAIETVAASDGGLKWISQTFKTCDALQSANDLKNYLNNMYGNMAMANYPYPANFLAELPGQPVKAMCDKLITTSTDPKTILQSLFEGTSIYFNYTGTSQCLDLSDTDSQDLGMEGWTYQTCTEMVMPMCDKGDTMFQKTEWNLEETSDECYAQFQVRPIVNYVRNLYGAKELSFTSNIIFSNGYLDPWSSGGVLHSVSKDSLVTGPMQGAAHHLDLRSSNPLDPPSIKRARQMYRKVMTRWVQEIL